VRTSEVRQTTLHKWKGLIPLFEAVMNSFQAIREGGHAPGNGFIKIEVEREGVLLSTKTAPIAAFRITDNGVGLNKRHFNSFNTSFSDLKAEEGGKGVGRIMWLVAFDRVEIDSVYMEASGIPYRRKFVFDQDYDEEKVKAVPASCIAANSINRGRDAHC